MSDLPLVTASQMREIEARAAERGETSPVLMSRAARSVAAAVEEALGGARRKRILVLIGPGNNGGDGLWAGVYLRQAGAAVTCYIWKRAASGDDPALAAAGEHNLPLLRAQSDKDLALLRRGVAEADLLIDAFLGAGLDRDVSGDLTAIIGVVNDGVEERRREDRPLPVVAVDLPTGIDSDSGALRGAALHASTTVTLGLPKIGLYQYPGAHYAGQVVFGDIGVTDLATEEIETRTAGAEQVRRIVPPRPADANKGTFGRLLIVAGSVNYIGAPVLATLGALRSGVGLATLATPAELLPIVAAKLTESTFLPLPADMGALIERAADRLFKALDERPFDVLLIGPGLGQEKETQSFFRNLLLGEHPHHEERAFGFGIPSRRATTSEADHNQEERPIGFGIPSRRATTSEAEHKERKLPMLVIDADGLNMLAQIDEWSKHLPANGILTPHPGEMGRLLGVETDEVQADRVKTARDASASWGQVVVLKGANTVVAEPGGQVTIIPFATAALASAGTGDVLAGCIAGLLAQGLSPYDAAVAGAYVHGLAGVIASRQYGDAGVLASDVAGNLPLALREIKSGEGGGR